MADLNPKAQVDLQELALHEGAPVLLRRALRTLVPGQLLEIRGHSPNLAEDLGAWCRKEGHGFRGNGGARNIWRIERGAGPSPLIARQEGVQEKAEPSWGLAPRGARVEAGGPEFSFTLRAKREVWAQDLSSIYKQAVANQWSAARDIRWSDLPNLDQDLEAAVCQIMTFLTENEFAALYVPARFIPRIHPHYREVVEVLAVQVMDEARHAEAFTRRAEAGGLGLGTTAVSGQLSLQTLLEEPDFTTAAFLLCVMGEGTFLTLLKFLEEHAPEPVAGPPRGSLPNIRRNWSVRLGVGRHRTRRGHGLRGRAKAQGDRNSHGAGLRQGAGAAAGPARRRGSGERWNGSRILRCVRAG